MQNFTFERTDPSHSPLNVCIRKVLAVNYFEKLEGKRD
jgi:hypothetical protein